MNAGTALLVRLARRDPSAIDRTRRRGARAIRRGVGTLATTPIATGLFYGLGHRLPDGVLWGLGMYVGVALGVGLALVIVGVRRRALASSADRVLAAGQLPVARLLT